jgi:hypothetical protein
MLKLADKGHLRIGVERPAGAAGRCVGSGASLRRARRDRTVSCSRGGNRVCLGPAAGKSVVR